MSESSPDWQVLASEFLDRPQPPHLRMSAAGKCPRALAYAHMECQESNPPDDHSFNRMSMGHMAEILIVRNLHKNGWETDHTVLSPTGQLELEFQIPGTDVVLIGHPDGICMHPEFTKGKWVPLECKSMSVMRGEETQKLGVAETYPEYITQISLYGRELQKMGLVSHPRVGVFAMMDRDGRPLPPERVGWEDSMVDETLEKLRQVVETVERGEIPERPYGPNSLKCRYCNYNLLCRGPEDEIVEQVKDRSNGYEIKKTWSTDDPDIVGAAQRWLNLKPKMDDAKDILQNASDTAGKADVVAGIVVAGYFQPRNPPAYDPEILDKLVPGDILRKCRLPEERKRQGFWIRQARG